ncbi:UDP-galactose 4-epimerase [Dacryopinax primogenitus]|uniref:UDP-galactose 4-epimerase n=1 Tax=Dacryopinax primogenitus (strain DJM 731) TaxID=1858805 RepID=M5FR03_DACPD|nr:UDP-galactose 4-epimerase [Dacryopinax primogenitus]EJT99460.1 UDP-galactose 4-epimerase [Dacryopinax primogenitus]
MCTNTTVYNRPLPSLRNIGRELEYTTSAVSERIAVTGARGLVGKVLTKYLKEQGHYVIEINRTPEKDSGDGVSEQRTAEATDYNAVKEAFRGADAVIHLAAVPDPIKRGDHVVHNVNAQSGYNALHAAGGLGIKRFVFASSINAHGLAYSQGKIEFTSFPLDETIPPCPSDPYALSKALVETQCASFARIYPDMRIVSLRCTELSLLKELEPREEEEDARWLWSWVNPSAAARAFLLAITAGDFVGHEIFYIVAPVTDRKEPTMELIQKWWPGVPIKGDMSGTKGFFDCSKAHKMLGWVHVEQE